MTLIALTVIVAFAVYIMKPEERLRVVRTILRMPAIAFGGASKRTVRRQAPISEAPREPGQWGLVVPAIAAINVVVFLVMAVAPGVHGDPDTLVAWGGSFGPKTTNGEWGRLLVSMFVHVGPLHLLATMAGLIQAGLIVERHFGRLTFSAVYMTAGFFASGVSLWLHPTDVSVGASGAVFGIFGFLVATSIMRIGRSSEVTIPLQALKACVPAGALFVAYTVLGGGLPFEAELAGCVAGFVSGLVIAGHIVKCRPAPLRVFATVAATFTFVAGITIPLYGMADVRPEIQRVLSLEDGTSVRYHSAVERFKKGVISARELAGVIKRTISPELRLERTRLASLGRIPRPHQALVARAEVFLRLREESWRVRATALETGNMAMLRKADLIETNSLETLALIKTPVLQ
jgi:membrane associated rhomboid family serine protease